MRVTGRLKQAYIASRVAHVYAQAQSKFVTVDGARLHFVIKGAGRPVILIHGNPGSCQDWARLYTPISSRYQAIAFDRPGHGHSDRPNHRDITVDIQAQMLHTALRELQIERPILVGHSWGGALALAYALEFPDDLSGLVLLAPAVYESDDGVSFLSKLPGFPIIGDIVNFLFTPLIGPWLVRTDVTKAFAPDPIPKNYLRHVLSEWTRPKKVKWYSIDDALLNESLPKLSLRYAELIKSNHRESDSFDSSRADSVSERSRLRVPVSIVTGDSDLIVPAIENAHRLYKALPHSELVVLEKTGHQIPFTRPDAVVDAIDQVAAKAAH
ncbi:MAG TPA: alpha/beta hydrolase [Pyrinomonadaceae bacterium]|nr:alpha/beta hydrolase [Pyrinomonadaceae bacterium]